MRLYTLNVNQHLNNKKNLVVILTTTQSPHLEAYFHFIEKYISIYNKIFILDAVSNSDYRNEFTWRDYVPFRQNLTRKLRNGFFKNLYIRRKIKLLGFKASNLNVEKDCLLSKKEIFAILKTYSMTEFRSASFTSTGYDNYIINSISFVSAAIKQFIFKFKANKKDDFLIFNGRHPLEFSIRITLQKLNYNRIVYHECNNYDYKVYYTNFQIHNLNSYKNLISKYKLAHSNLLDKWLTIKNLKDKKSAQKKFVIYFTSSFDEYSFAYNNPINQPLLISKLLSNKSSLPLRIRVHPNTRNKSVNDRLFWDFLKNKYGEVIINYDEDISSYDLICKSFFTISIGSSIAPESLMLGVNHLLCGTQHMYNHLPGFYRCNEESFMNTVDLLYKNRHKLMKLTKNSKEYAAASQLFNKEMGETIPLAFLGAYPFKLSTNKFFSWAFKNSRK
jgi:hypothetical protein